MYFFHHDILPHLGPKAMDPAELELFLSGMSQRRKSDYLPGQACKNFSGSEPFPRV